MLGQGEVFLKAAHDKGKKSLWLIENHNMLAKDESLLDKRLPEVVAKNPHHLIYYYPRNLENPDVVMNIMVKHLARK